MFEGSCSCTDMFCELEPTVPVCAGGPFLLPGAPAIPAPEFCALGDVAAPLALLVRSPGMFAAEPGLSCSPTKPEAPEFCVLMPLSASLCTFWLGAACCAIA